MTPLENIVLNILYCLSTLHLLLELGESCQRPPSPANGRVWFRVHGGLTAIYTCDVGYLLKGTNVSQCQTDGQWSSPPPKCHLPASSCSETTVDVLNVPTRGTILIDCEGRADKNTNRYWLKDGHRIDDSESAGVTVLANFSLLIHSGKKNIEGIYYCLRQRETKVGISKAVRLVKDSSKYSLAHGDCNLKFKDMADVVYGNEEKSVFLRCNVEPPAMVEWYKEGKLVQSVDNYQLLPEGTLYIANLKASDTGKYVCLARTSALCNATKIVEVKFIDSPAEGRTYECGKPFVKHRVKRIIDGVRALNNSHPWMCMLSTPKIAVVCGCSLISNQWVVTAGHCFWDDGEVKAKRYLVKLGKRQRGQVEKEEVIVPVSEVVVHPEYRKRLVDSDGNRLSNDNDIALLKLETPVDFKYNILPICLPKRGFVDSLPDDTLGVVTGWGRVSLKGSVVAVTLQEAYLPIVQSKLCKLSSSYVITENMFCAGYAESYKPDTCFGDSGGPLTVESDGKWYLAGVISWGEGCSTPRKYGIYTKVENYIQWIENVISKDVF